LLQRWRIFHDAILGAITGEQQSATPAFAREILIWDCQDFLKQFT
jgi:hypothetical protein